MFPVLRYFFHCLYFVGWTDVVRAPIKFASALVGNVPGALTPIEVNDSQAPTRDVLRDPTKCLSSPTSSLESPVTSVSLASLDSPDPSSTPAPSDLQVDAVHTRSRRMKRLHPLVLPALQPLAMTPDKFSQLQASCLSLSDIRDKAASKAICQTRNGATFQYIMIEIDGLLYRKCLTSKHPEKVGKITLIVPLECRQIILSVAHESPLSGHFSHRKTEMKVAEQFFWPSVGADIRAYCRSCDKCQRFSAKGRVRPAPLKPMPIISEPFLRVAIDLVGPLSPPSSDGHRFILTLIGYATGFPEAVHLKDVDSVTVAEALLSIFSRVGIPREILTDRGTQFTSHLMAELHKLLGVKPIFTMPYHPSGNGRIERLHGPLKSSLRKLCEEKPREWHRYLRPALFALREVPSDRTGFSAFDLLYGRSVRGPLTVLRDLWEDRRIDNQERNQFQYVIELREKLSECAKIAAQHADVSSNRHKAYFDVRSQNRQFKPGEEVLVLLPSENSKLLISWRGPYKVLERKGKVEFLIDEPKGPTLYHVNLLKKYSRRAQSLQASLLDEVPTLVSLNLHTDEENVLPTIHEDEEFYQDYSNVLPLTPDGLTDSLQNQEPEIGESLTTVQQVDLKKLLAEFDDVFSNTPGCTNTLVHDISLHTTDRVQAKVYPVPIHLKPFFEEEVETLSQQGIIQHSTSPHCSPVVMVKKSDDSYRMGVDYRQLNSQTVFDAEPAFNMEKELDLCKAYYQVPLSEGAKSLTAFPTHLGLMEFNRMPFGLVNACATYIHLMRIVLAGLPNVSFYFNNVFIYSPDWSTHLSAVRSVICKLRDHRLTFKPSKCRFGVGSIRYLGFWLDGINFWPMQDKISSINRLPPPSTKKLMCRFLGLISFYKNFIPQASEYTGPLSNLLKKPTREPLTWNEDLLNRFGHLKVELSTAPLLRLPNPNLTFVLRTDASNQGLGTVLLQYYDEHPHPVSHGSRKLLDCEKRYSTIEKECLAVIFAIVRFEFYLRGKEFILEFDHKPLVYLNTFRGKNDRLMRWSLSLQAYKCRDVHIAGEENLVADLLSRST